MYVEYVMNLPPLLWKLQPVGLSANPLKDAERPDESSLQLGGCALEAQVRCGQEHQLILLVLDRTMSSVVSFLVAFICDVEIFLGLPVNAAKPAGEPGHQLHRSISIIRK